MEALHPLLSLPRHIYFSEVRAATRCTGCAADRSCTAGALSCWCCSCSDAKVHGKVASTHVSDVMCQRLPGTTAGVRRAAATCCCASYRVPRVPSAAAALRECYTLPHNTSPCTAQAAAGGAGGAAGGGDVAGARAAGAAAAGGRGAGHAARAGCAARRKQPQTCVKPWPRTRPRGFACLTAGRSWGRAAWR